MIRKSALDPSPAGENSFSPWTGLRAFHPGQPREQKLLCQWQSGVHSHCLWGTLNCPNILLWQYSQDSQGSQNSRGHLKQPADITHVIPICSLNPEELFHNECPTKNSSSKRLYSPFLQKSSTVPFLFIPCAVFQCVPVALPFPAPQTDSWSTVCGRTCASPPSEQPDALVAF